MVHHGSRLKPNLRTLAKKDIKLFVRGKIKRNQRRILRRKRSKVNYWKNRQQQRLSRHNQTLCDEISVCSITDMDFQDEFQGSLIQPIPEIAEWQNQHQISYWKSRALALELENKVLHKHIENLYAKQTQDYIDYGGYNEYYVEEDKKRNWPTRREDKEESPCENDLNVTKSEGEYHCKKQGGNRKRNNNSNRQQIWRAPEESASKKKLEEMKTLYGDMAPKILGMETAIQLNYDLYLEKYNPKHWPNIPLRL